MNYVLIFIGGGVGSALRYGASRASLELIGPNFPAGTLFVNVVGSTLMGILAAWFALRGEADQTARLFLTTGIIGGFTTFSTFSLDIAVLWGRGEQATTIGYVLATLVLSVAGLFAGIAATRTLMA
jgi:CrcB protein